MLSWTDPEVYSFLMSTAVKTSIVLASAWILAHLLYRQSASVRHLVWTASFAALLVLPLLSLSLPAVAVPWQRTLLPAALRFQADAFAPGIVPARQERPHAKTASASNSGARSHNWSILLVLLWAAGSAVSMAQMLVSWACIQRIRRAARPLKNDDFRSLARRLGIDREPDLLETGPRSMPMTFGIFRRAVFVPREAEQWTKERRRVVLLHELAHVVRADTVWHILARTALSAYWWNPLAWVAWREFLKERERAADDLVLGFGTQPAEYATHLLDIARSMQSSTATRWAAVAMARPPQLQGRLSAILDNRRKRRTAGRVSAMATVIVAIAAVAPLAALRGEDAKVAALPADPDAFIRDALAQKNPAMLDEAAEIAEAAGKFDVAQKLLDSSLSIRAERSGQQSVEYGIGLLKLGDLAREQGIFSQAKTTYTNALALLGTGPDASTVLIHLGTVTLARKEFDEANENLTRAQSLNANKASEAALWMAITQQREGNFDQADSLYQGALAGEDPDSVLAATTMEMYAQFLQQQGRGDQAVSMRERAEAIRKQIGEQLASSSKDADPNVYRIGGAVSAPKLVSKVEPVYSQEARIAKYQGTVLFRVEIGSDGLAHDIQVIRGLGFGLNQRAIQAIRQWRFNPGLKDGQPVTVMANIEVNFRLR